jgi:hypothetical protein
MPVVPVFRGAGMTVGLHCQVELVRIHLQSQHRLDVLSSTANVIRCVIPQAHHMFEAMLDFLAQRVGKQADQSIR